MNDPEYLEQWRYKDTIDDYKMVIKEFEKLYEQTPVTDRYVRARIISGLNKSRRATIIVENDCVLDKEATS